MINLDFYINFFIYSLFIQLISFVPAFLLKTDKLTDITYAATFILLTLKAYNTGAYSIERLVPVICIMLWGLRLGSYLLYRIIKTKKDKRFDGIRENFLKFLSFFILQGIVVFSIAIPILTFLTKTPASKTSNYWFFLGITIWLTGFIIETIADYQKFSFIQKNSSLWIDHGLWHYSRHPNYFGEILCWTGLYLYTMQNTTIIEALVFFCLSPALITILLTKISGIPILEKEADKRWGENPHYQKYKETTNILLLLPKKESCS